MTAPHPIPESDPDDRRAADTAAHRDILNEMVALGATLIRIVAKQAEAEPATAPDAAIAYERVTRSVRRSIMLVHKLDEPARSRIAARKRILRGVEDIIQRETDGDEFEAETLHAELLERLDTPDFDDDIDDGLPVADIIADIRRDLGLDILPGAHPWKRRTPEDVAVLCARAAQPRAAWPSPAEPAQAPRQTPPLHPSG